MSMYATLPLSLRQIQYLLAVAETGGFRRAADVCHVAQPSLSAQVALAERALGVRVFERDRRRVRVSRAGAMVLAHARRVITAVHDLGEVARAHADPFRATLRVGIIPTVCPYLLPDITPLFTRELPHLTVLWSEDRTARLVAAVSAGELDGALVALESDLGDLDHLAIGRDAFVLAAARSHPLMRSKKSADPAALRDASVLLLEDGHCLREQALALCAREGAEEASLRATSLATLVQMVGSGSSVTLLPSLAVPVENRRGQLGVRRFRPPGPGRTLAFAWRRGSASAVPLRAAADVLRRAWPGLTGKEAQTASTRFRR
jgi:LysR family hydrogen peroxide-inducible transcriptional activator